MAAEEPAIWQVELIRQRHRLKNDVVARLLGILLACGILSLFLPFWYLFFTFLAIVAVEVSLNAKLTEIEVTGSRRGYVSVLVLSAAGAALFSIPPLFLWLFDDPMARFLAPALLVSALLSVAVVRSAHLPIGFLTGIVPALALIWLPGQYLFDPTLSLSAVAAVVGALAIVAYAARTMVLNHRDEAQVIHRAAVAEAHSRDQARIIAGAAGEAHAPFALMTAQIEEAARSGALPEASVAALATSLSTIRSLVADMSDLSLAADRRIPFRPMAAIIRDELQALRGTLRRSRAGQPDVIEIDVSGEVPDFGRFDPALLRRCLGSICVLILEDQKDRPARQLHIRCAMAPGRRDRLRLTLAGAKEPDEAPFAADGHPAIEPTTASMLARSIVEIMGGQGEIFRAPDQSLCARIELPFVTVPEPPAMGAEATYGRLRALVIDDDAGSRFELIQHLRSLRIEAKEATDEPAVIDRLAHGTFELILLDMSMANAPAIFGAIRGTDETWSAIPVIGLTRESAAERRDGYQRMGLDGLVTEPVDRRLLWAEILTALPPPPPL